MSADQMPPPPIMPGVGMDDLSRFKDVLGPVAQMFVKEFTESLKAKAAPAIMAGLGEQIPKTPAMIDMAVNHIAKAVGAGILIGLQAQYQVTSYNPETDRDERKVVTGAQLLQDLIDSNLELAASNMPDDEEEEEEEIEPVRPRKRGR